MMFNNTLNSAQRICIGFINPLNDHDKQMTDKEKDEFAYVCYFNTAVKEGEEVLEDAYYTIEPFSISGYLPTIEIVAHQSNGKEGDDSTYVVRAFSNYRLITASIDVSGSLKNIMDDEVSMDILLSLVEKADANTLERVKRSIEAGIVFLNNFITINTDTVGGKEDAKMGMQNF